MKKFALLLLALCAALVPIGTLAVPGWAETITKDMKAEKINEVISNATGEVTFEPASYDLDATIKIGKTVTLKGNGARLNGQNQCRVFEITDGEPTIDGFVIANGRADKGGGIYKTSGTLTVTNCRFEGNTADMGGGIYSETIGSLTVKRCTFYNNTGGNGGGIHIEKNTDADVDTIENCTFTENKTQSNNSNGGGLYVCYGGSVTVNYCTFVNNKATMGAEIYCDDGNDDDKTSRKIGNSIIYGSTAGVDTSTCLTNNELKLTSVPTSTSDEKTTVGGVTHTVFRNHAQLFAAEKTGTITLTEDQLGAIDNAHDIGAVEIAAAPVTLTGVSVDITGNTPLTVTQGQTGTLTLGATVTATYSNGKTETLTSGYNLAWKATGTLPAGFSFTDGTLTVGTEAAATDSAVLVPVEVQASTTDGSVTSQAATANVSVTVTEKSSDNNTPVSPDDNKSGGGDTPVTPDSDNKGGGDTPVTPDDNKGTGDTPAPVTSDDSTALRIMANSAIMEAASGQKSSADLSDYAALVATLGDGTMKPIRNAALSFAQSGNWPSWLTIDSNGKVTANPTNSTDIEDGDYNYTVTDGGGSSGITNQVTTSALHSGVKTSSVVTKTLSVKAVTPEPAKITTTFLGNATVTKSYSDKIVTTGMKPIKYQIVKGSLPEGLTLNKDTGEISGKPNLDKSSTPGTYKHISAVGTYAFTVRASNAAGADERAFTLKVKDVKPNFRSWLVKIYESKYQPFTVLFRERMGTHVEYKWKTDVPPCKSIPDLGSGAGESTIRFEFSVPVNRGDRDYTIYVTAHNSTGLTKHGRIIRYYRDSGRAIDISDKFALPINDDPLIDLAADDEDTDGHVGLGDGVTYYVNGEVDPDTGNISAVIGTAVPNVEGAEYVYPDVDTMLAALAGRLDKVVRLEFRRGAAGTLDGLDKLPNLAELSVDESDVTELDLRGKTALTSLSLYACKDLTSLDVTGCSSLSAVMINDCSKLTDLTGMGECSGLESLSLYGTAVTALDVSGFASLANLDVTGCEKLTSLKAANCTALESLSANGCPSLATLVLSGCNALTDVSLNGAKMTALNLSGCAGLKSLSLAEATALSSLKLPSGVVFENFKLTDSQVPELNLSGCLSLDVLVLSGNAGLVSLDVSGIANLKELDVSNCAALKELNASNCPALEKLTANGCAELYSLNIEGCGVLSELYLSGAKWLLSLDCAGRRLGRLDLGGLNRLSQLKCGGQSISGVPLGKTLDLTPYVGYTPSLVTEVQGYGPDGSPIETTWDTETGVATFASVPATVTYVYDTGLEGVSMDVTLSLTGAPSGGDSPTSDKDGGGCDAGLGLAGLLVLCGLVATRKK